jgi:hypothetical protein
MEPSKGKARKGSSTGSTTGASAVRSFATAEASVAFSPRPLTNKERRDALNGRGEIGAAANLYLSLLAHHQIHTEKTASTEAEKLDSIGRQYDSIPSIHPVVAATLMRFVSLAAKGLEPNLPKPPPFVVMYAVAILNKAMGLQLAEGGARVSAGEFVTSWGLSEWLKQNPSVRVSEREFAQIFSSERQRTRAARPRRKRVLARYVDRPTSFSVSRVDAEGKVTITEKATGESCTVMMESIERARRRKKIGR